jgi:TrmH family RNA methyltransferase
LSDVDRSEREIVEQFQSARRDQRLVVLEGFHALKHAARFGADLVDVVTRDADSAARLAQEHAPDLAPRLADAEVVASEVFARLSPRPHPTGVVAIARRPSPRAVLAEIWPEPVVVLEDPRRPENLGAVVRVAAAAGAAGVVALGGVDPDLLGADPSAPAGLLVAFDPSGEPLVPGAIPPGALLAFGTERRGLSGALLARADRRLAIPMREGVSSLNLATAVAVALYAWRLEAR